MLHQRRDLHNAHMRCEVASEHALVQYLASNVIRHGYWHYFLGKIPAHKEAAAVDAKLVERYGADLDKFSRARRKAKGLANVIYVRLDREFLLVATDGDHIIFSEHPMKDFRREHLRLHGYQVGAGRGADGKFHAGVRIGDAAFSGLADFFMSIAVHWSASRLAEEFRSIQFVRFARVRRQLLKLLRLVNERRRVAGFELVPTSALQLRRTIVSVFSLTSSPQINGQ